MAHTFLIEAGRWRLQGSWLERDGKPLQVKGKTIIVWNQDNWFTWVTKLIFPEEKIPGINSPSQLSEISLQYRGRLSNGQRQYTFVLQQSLLGRVEGEGWMGLESIVQRYWVLNDRQRRSGFETLYRLNDDIYHFSSSLLEGYRLISTMEAVLERQA